jgi:hypothetical protein
MVDEQTRNLMGDYRDKSRNHFDMDQEDRMNQDGDIGKPEPDGFPDRITKKCPASR